MQHQLSSHTPLPCRAPESLWLCVVLCLGVIALIVCKGPTKPIRLTQPLQGTITLEHQQEHSWISIILTGPDTLTVYTESNGAYTLPTLTDGTWSVFITYPYYIPVEDTIQITNGRVTRFTPHHTLTQLLQLRALTDRTTYTPGDTVVISLITRNLTAHPMTLYLPAAPAQYYVIRQNRHTITHSIRFGAPVISTITFTPGIAETTFVSWWIPGQFPDQSSVSSGSYTVFTLWAAADTATQAVLYSTRAQWPDYFAIAPEHSPAAESLLRIVTPTSITLTAPPP